MGNCLEKESATPKRNERSPQENQVQPREFSEAMPKTRNSGHQGDVGEENGPSIKKQKTAKHSQDSASKYGTPQSENQLRSEESDVSPKDVQVDVGTEAPIKHGNKSKNQKKQETGETSSEIADLKKQLGEKKADNSKLQRDARKAWKQVEIERNRNGHQALKQRDGEIAKLKADLVKLNNEKDDLLTRDARKALKQVEIERNRNGHQALTQRDGEIAKLKAELVKLNNEKDDLLTRNGHQALKQRDGEIAKLKAEFVKLNNEKDDLLTRISAIAGARLLDNNPNIADLSDSNRPTKLAEQYSELYDNEWTDAYTHLEEDGVSDVQSIKLLFDILKKIYQVCKQKADGQNKALDDSVSEFLKGSDLPPEMSKHFKENRKKNYKEYIPELQQDVKAQVEKLYLMTEKRLDETVPYQTKCLEICWLMCIQDPPVYIDCDIQLRGQRFDKGSYKEYTQSGPIVDFVVWPVVFLQKGGSMLCKGTVQCTSSKDDLTELKEKDDLLTGAIEATGPRLPDNNPNIADLSDSNRSTKVANKYSELYENEWMDAFTALEKDGVSEVQSIKLLFDILKNMYQVCKQKMDNQNKALDDYVSEFLKGTALRSEMSKHFKESRKKNYKEYIPELQQDVKSQVKELYLMTEKRLKETVPYQTKCLEICWLMCIQDPPVYIDCDIQLRGQRFDKSSYKEYTQSGPIVDFVVWPVVFLQKGGFMFCKGTVQCTSSKDDLTQFTQEKPPYQNESRSRSLHVTNHVSKIAVGTPDLSIRGSSIASKSCTQTSSKSKSQDNSVDIGEQKKREEKHKSVSVSGYTSTNKKGTEAKQRSSTKDITYDSQKNLQSPLLSVYCVDEVDEKKPSSTDL